MCHNTPVVEKRARHQHRPGPALVQSEGTFQAVSLTTIVMFALGYLAVLIVVTCMLVATKRADERVHEHDALVRSMTRDLGAPERPQQDRDRTLSLTRHAG